MSTPAKPTTRDTEQVRIERTFQRFTLAQRWEHTVLLLCIAVLLLTGLPQKYRTASWSQAIISTPERLITIQTIHRIAGVILILEVLYHLGHAVLLLSRRRLPGDILPNWQDVRDAFEMMKYLLFINRKKPDFGKYNFEQKFTYWFMFFAIGILVISGLIQWFPELTTRILPGGIIPAAKLAHSTEAIATAIFIVIWHFYHVHVERLNLSIFTGRINEEDLQKYHAHQYQQIVSSAPQDESPGVKS